MAAFDPAPTPAPPPAPPAAPLVMAAQAPAAFTSAQVPVDDEEDKLIRAGRRAPVLAWTKNGEGRAPGPQPALAPTDPVTTGGVRPPDSYASYGSGYGAGGYGGPEIGGSAPAGAYGGARGPARPLAAAERDEFNTKLQPTRLEGVRAGHLGNRDFVLAMGAQIPCTLETAMSSDQPGFVSCVVSRDILSDNGRVVLLDKGTQIVGEYRGGLKRGQNRMFVLWNRAKTPTGVIVSLASPGTDALGRAGFSGEVDTHFFERFGAAMLLSVVDDGLSLGVAALQAGNGGGTTTNVFVPTAIAQGARSSAAIAVQESINIPPTLNKNQGESVNVFVARDLDFSSVYGLRVTESRTRVLDRASSGDFGPAPAVVVTKP
ncbi:MAG TPA: type IV secretion system protein VirB10 [Beijerinckiaceae bacterium]|nr:type IV secretion system protein VirB10 [Beijerinckiaceae bacterium]